MHLHKLLAITHMHTLVAVIAQHGAIRKEDPTPPELVVEGRVAFLALYVAVFVAQPRFLCTCMVLAVNLGPHSISKLFTLKNEI